MNENIKVFIEDLENLLQETSLSLDSAFLTDSFIENAERNLMIPNIEDVTVEME